MPRIERDALGELELPDEAYFGVQTARAVANFPVSGVRVHPDLLRGYLLVKKAAALTNMELKVLDKVKGGAIVKAADEVLIGQLSDQFPLDVFQAGAGTSLNMNLNEVLANRALEILRKPKADYGFISPNDHVNLGQSSNDTFPTAAHLAGIFAGDRLRQEIVELARSFSRKGAEFRGVRKSGRTHLMDALPVSLGDELRAYGAALERAGGRLEQRRSDLRELPIGGTAVGTGIGSHRKFREVFLKKLSVLCGLEFTPARDSFEVLQSRAQLAAFSSALKELALELIRIANDLRLLASGPYSGIGEIELPAVQPGSSIMPGKVNPSLAECLNMIGFQVVGNDTTVMLAAQAGQLELNVMAPVMIQNILQALSLLVSFLPVFRTRCVDGIRPNPERCAAALELNPSLVTLLVPRLGYLKAAELAKEAVTRKMSIADLAVERRLMSREEADEMLGQRE